MRLAEAITRYVEHKNSSGIQFGHGKDCLMSLCRRTGNIELAELKNEHVSSFLDFPATSTVTWRGKHQILTQFFIYLASRRISGSPTMPLQRVPVRQTFVPYVYSRTEIRMLLRATKQTQNAKSQIDARTLRMFLLLAYATGAPRKELMNLKSADVDLAAGILTLGVGVRSRRIPICSGVQIQLRRYSEWRQRRHLANESFFVTKNGSPLNSTTLVHTFRRLRRAAGIVRGDSCEVQPRMQDFRTTFAVHRITAWIRCHADLNRMLPALAAYMGQSGLGSTENYLSLTPVRFQKQLNILSPKAKRKHWRNDRSLMRFLSTV
jgi:integrase/recombinase XerD